MSRGRFDGASSRRPLVVLSFLVGAMLVNSPSAAATHPAPDGSDSDWVAYAALIKGTVEDAQEDAALVKAASTLQLALEAEFGSDFAGLWIDREPSFTVVAAFTSDHLADVLQLAPVALVPYLRTRVVEHSLQELAAAIPKLAIPNIDHTLSIDIRSNQIEVRTTADQRRVVADSLSDVIGSGMVRVIEATAMPTPVAIYGGRNHETTCGGLQGTIGFSVSQNGTGTTGVVTAGHLANCGKVDGWTLTFKNESNAGDADAEWFTSGTTEPARFQYNEFGGERVVAARKAYAAVVVGEVDCKYGRTTGYDCGEVHSKTVDVDGLFGPFSAVWIELQDCGGETLSDHGDSGGPVFLNNTAIGIITHGGGDIFCGGKAYINSLTHFESVLGLTVRVI